MFIVPLFIKVKIWKKARYSLIDEPICKEEMEYDLAIKRNEILSLVTTWIFRLREYYVK